MQSAEEAAVSTPAEWSRIKDISKALGIKSNRFYTLLRNTKEIRACTLKTSPGAGRGAIFVHVPTLMAYMEKLAAERVVVANNE
jgi:hypothetical protein